MIVKCTREQQLTLYIAVELSNRPVFKKFKSFFRSRCPHTALSVPIKQHCVQVPTRPCLNLAGEPNHFPVKTLSHSKSCWIICQQCSMKPAAFCPHTYSTVRRLEVKTKDLLQNYELPCCQPSRHKLLIIILVNILYCSKVWSQYFFVMNKLILLFSKDALNWSKVTVKTLIMLQKVSISNKCCSFELCLIKLNSSLANFDSDTPNFQIQESSWVTRRKKKRSENLWIALKTH